MKNITVFRLSSKTQNKDGFNISKTLLDESHDIREANAQSEVAEACWRGMSSKDQPLFLNCTTQGFNRDCYLDRQILKAKRVISGEQDDINFLPFLFEQDSEQEIWQDEKTWQKSNPSLIYGVKKINKLKRDVETAKTDKATRIHLLTKDFNLPQSNAQTWLMLEVYDYAAEPINFEELRGAFLLGAVDLSATTDLTSAKALIMLPDSNKKIFLSHYRIPESKLQNSPDKEAGAEYEQWAKDGLLTIDEGNEVNISGVADWYAELFRTFELKPYKIGYDERFAKTFVDRCEEYGFDTVQLGQGFALSNAMKLTEADLRSQIINYNQNPIDKWCLSNCCCKGNDYGDIQPVKIPGQKEKRIDGALTFIMAEEMYRRYKDEYIKIVKGE
jgi:phage terminase large subunit-like protein